jgi:two-component system, LytTR family, response regulator
MPIRTLIVDDEPLARKELRRLLAAHPQIEIAAEAAGVAEAQAACLHALALGRPFDLLLLDVEMPDGTGFDLLDRLGTTPETIFVTAYDHHAVRAFRTHALDYLVKPVDPDELAVALSRLHRRLSASTATPQGGDGPRETAPRTTRLFVKDGAHAVLIPLAEIRLIEAAGDYSRIVHGRPAAAILSARSLAALEPMLGEEGFFRGNRQQILGLDHVARIEALADSRLIVHLDHGESVVLSTRRSHAFRERFG